MQVVLDTLEYGSRIKKTPVVVGNCTGFAVNRVFFPYTQSACMLVDLGMDPYMVDKAIAGAFGMPMGPFRWVAIDLQPASEHSFPSKFICSCEVQTLTSSRTLKAMICLDLGTPSEVIRFCQQTVNAFIRL